MNDVFVHPQAICESQLIGPGTRVWAFAHILPGARVGSDCNICDGVFIENDVSIGNRVTLKCGVQVWDGLLLEDDVFVGPNATFANDRFPRSKMFPPEFLRTIIRQGASIGANATILPGLEIGTGAMVGAGAVVTRSVPANAIVVGNPARIVGYVDAGPEAAGPIQVDTTGVGTVGHAPIGVGRASLHQLKAVRDLRGNLTVAEFEREIPFTPKRYFLVYDVPTREVRGEHAHHICHQFLICIKGSCVVLLDDGATRRQVMLDRINLGVYMPPLIWGTQYQYTNDAVLLVFASHYYDSEDYIRTYSDYLRIVRP